MSFVAMVSAAGNVLPFADDDEDELANVIEMTTAACMLSHFFRLNEELQLILTVIH